MSVEHFQHGLVIAQETGERVLGRLILANLGVLYINMGEDGPCTLHLPTDEYKLEDTVAVPAKAGDIVLFCIDTIHGSYINQTKKPRRLVRVGYRDPQNRQFFGQSYGRPGLMVAGYRERVEGDELF